MDSEKFVKSLEVATDEVSQVQPLYREEIMKAVKHSKKVNVEGKFASNGKLIDYPTVKMSKVIEEVKDSEGVFVYTEREQTISDITVKGTDGLFEMEYLRINEKEPEYIGFVTLLECKLDQDFNDKLYRAKVILQCICYLKQIKEGKLCKKGEYYKVPEVMIIGSKRNCFVLSKDAVDKYIDLDIKDYQSASTAGDRNPEIVADLMKDEAVLSECFIRGIDSTFDMVDVIKDVYSKVSGKFKTIKMTEDEIAKVFDIFSMQVLTKADKIEGRQQAKYFLKLILEPDACYQHPKKPNKLVIGEDIVDIEPDKYLAFRAQYGVEKNYSLNEQREFTAIADRLIEDADRRRRGDFYTPTIWVNEAHKLISKHLGNNWRNEYMVWDCACGTMNLTRDYKFKDLYASTLIEGDLTLSEKYNTNATKFQYDFLNDDVDIFEELARRKALNGSISLTDFMELSPKLYQVAPSLIQGLLSGKKLLFFINPPYGTSGNMSQIKTGESKAGIGKTLINDLMLRDKLGYSARQLYAQFVYRILLFRDLFTTSSVELCLFSKSAIQSSQSFEGLRAYIKNKFNLVDSFYFCASEFADCANVWGVLCSFWRDATLYQCNNMTRVCTVSLNGTVCSNLRQKCLYNVDNKVPCNQWLKPKNLSVVKGYPQLSSGLKVKDVSVSKSVFATDGLGCLFNKSDNVENNSAFVFMITACVSDLFSSFIHITPENFWRILSFFTARRLISGAYATWVNGKDSYMIPDTNHPDYAQFEADSVVYSLFNNASNQSSLRDITYNSKQWDIKNEFFWMSRAEMQALADGTDTTYGSINNEVEQDLLYNADDERYVYKQLQQVTLSPDAKAVLDKATELIKKSFKYRKAVSNLHPEYHLNTWDMGYYQLNKLIQECGDVQLQTEFKTFRVLYKFFEDRLRPLVYELGFLYK